MIFEIDDKFTLKSYDYSIESVPVLIGNGITYNDFFQSYMLPNMPCVIRGVISDWDSSKNWHHDGNVNFQYLRQRYGDKSVTVYNCSERYYNSQRTYEKILSEYLYYFQSISQVNDSHLEYLKDWHLKLQTDDNFYEVPIYFASDWLNEYYINCVKSDDYRFVYMGPKGTWTPFHSDVFSSFSWSANVCGRKRWAFFPPGEELLLRTNGNLPYDIDKENISAKHIELIQETGDIVFVPSGWHHQVWNLKDTVSVNHNWVNGCNIKFMLESLISCLKSVQKEIEDCRDMDNFNEHCQTMLNATFGMDLYKFYDFLKYIVLTRIDMLIGTVSRTLFHGKEIGSNHILFDLHAVRNVLISFNSVKEVYCLEYFETVNIKPQELLEKLKNILGP